MSTRRKQHLSRGRRAGAPPWILRVYVANQAARSVLALTNLERLCEQSIPGQYRIQIVDLLQHPDLCRADEIVAIPTVVRQFPLPHRRVIGTLADAQRAAAGL